MRKSIVFFSVFLIFFCVLVMGFADFGYAAYPLVKIAHPRPVQSATQADLEGFVKNIEKYSEGRVKCKIYGANQLGGPEQVMENVAMGTVEMLLGWPNTTLDNQLEVYCLPGMVSTYDEGRKVYKQGSPFINILNEVYGKHNQMVIAAYPSGFQYTFFKNKPDKSVYDPYAKKSIKLRQAPIKYLVYITDGLGYMTSTMPWGEVFTGLQTGIIDGLGSFSAESAYLSFRDAINYVLPVKTYLDVYLLTINKELWDSFSDNDKKAVSKAAAEFQEKRFNAVVESDKMYLKKLADHGVEILNITDEQQAAFQKRIKQYVWEHLRKDLGPKFFDKVTKAAEASVK